MNRHEQLGAGWRIARARFALNRRDARALVYGAGLKTKHETRGQAQNRRMEEHRQRRREETANRLQHSRAQAAAAASTTLQEAF